MHGGGAVGGGHGGFGGHGGLGGGHHGGFGGHHPGTGGDVVPPVIPRRRRDDPLSSPPFGPAEAPAATPPGVLVAVRLYLASAAALALGGVLGTIVSLRLLHAGAVRGSLPAGTSAAPEAVGATFVVVAVVGLLIVLGLKLFVAGRLRRGRNRARIAVLVLAVWDLGATLLRSGSFGRQFTLGPLSAAALVLELLGLVALTGATVLLFRPEANAWFRGSR